MALTIIEEGLREDLCTKITKLHQREGLASLVTRKMYEPIYTPLVHARHNHH